jgi:hypothetical protein
MPFDEETLQDFREIMSDNFSDLANIYRKIKVTTVGESTSVSDGMGGFRYNKTNSDLSKDERTKIHENIPCRVTVPRANRSDAEYTKNMATVSESRVVIVFPYNSDIREADRIDVKLSGKWRSFEVQVIADHSESYSLQANCVELKVQRT